jgi:ubiquinone/menaquinone biosynthesis C-methylase UbiE
MLIESYEGTFNRALTTFQKSLDTACRERLHITRKVLSTVNTGSQETASSANRVSYDKRTPQKKLKSEILSRKPSLLDGFYEKLMVDVYSYAAKHSVMVNVLDIGAGEGEATQQFLKLGANVTAVDISQNQLRILTERCGGESKLDILCLDVLNALEMLFSSGKRFDIVVAHSFLHHIPDYLDLISQATKVLGPSGQFLSLADPLRFDSLGKFTRFYDKFAYLTWRVSKGDLFNGLRRHFRRRSGIFLNDCIEDNVEYHCVRNGVDQDAIQALFRSMGFECNIIRYYATQRNIWQQLGIRMGIKNLFAAFARKIV